MNGHADGPTRRSLLRTVGAGAAAMGLAACGEEASPPGEAPDCVLTPEGSEGPYYLDLDLVRGDLTESRPGAGLRLAVTVVDAETCSALPDAAVDVWHADPDGRYSGTETDDTLGESFLRGVQRTDASGLAEFDTLYPGWYSGRTVHIHVKVHLGDDTVHTGQLYFPEEANDAVAQRAEYAGHGPRDTSNADDRFSSGIGPASTLDMTGSPDSGYTAGIVLGVRR